MISNSKKKSLRASNIELHSRDISLSKDNGIYKRDIDNMYPLRIENIINNSPTGKRCSNLMAKYIIGRGLDLELGKVKNKKGETLNSVCKQASQSLASQYGVYFHVNYYFDVENSIDTAKFKKSISVLDYVLMAKSKQDDDGFEGKFYKLDLEEKSIFAKSSKKTPFYYPYNSDKKVILAQMRNDCELAGITEPTAQQLISNYRGQVYYLNLTPKFRYSLPIWDVVYDDMDSEYRISRYVNSQTRNGWLGKTVVKKFADDEEENENASDSFNNQLKNNLGAENASNVLVIDVPINSTDDISKVFVIEQLKAQYDDKLFDATIKNLGKNIMGAFNNVPEALVLSSSGALFGTNSDAYLEMKKFYWEQNEWERQELEMALSEILDLPISFLPIINENIV